MFFFILSAADGFTFLTIGLAFLSDSDVYYLHFVILKILNANRTKSFACFQVNNQNQQYKPVSAALCDGF